MTEIEQYIRDNGSTAVADMLLAEPRFAALPRIDYTPPAE